MVVEDEALAVVVVTGIIVVAGALVVVVGAFVVVVGALVVVVGEDDELEPQAARTAAITAVHPMAVPRNR